MAILSVMLLAIAIVSLFSSWPVQKTKIDCFADEDEGHTICDFDTSFPERSNIVIKNISDSEINMLFSLNGEKLYGTLDEIITDVINSAPAFDGETIPEKLFRFLVSNHMHSLPLSAKEWYSNPMIYINSSGFGLCDDAAKALSMLGRAAGYETRVWDLNGHVITEVNVDGEWQYYDPDYNVYFYNEEGRIASLQDLISNPKLITNPEKIVDIPNVLNGAYSKSYAYKIITEDDNRTFTIDGTIALYPMIKIPPGGTSTFPNPTTGELKCIRDFEFSEYKSLELSIPRNTIGFFNPYLILYDIKGVGNVELKKNRFLLPSKSLKANLETNSVFFENTRVTDNYLGVKLFYLLNCNRFSLKEKNNLVITGALPEQIEVTLLIK